MNIDTAKQAALLLETIRNFEGIIGRAIQESDRALKTIIELKPKLEKARADLEAL